MMSNENAYIFLREGGHNYCKKKKSFQQGKKKDQEWLKSEGGAQYQLRSPSWNWTHS